MQKKRYAYFFAALLSCSLAQAKQVPASPEHATVNTKLCQAAATETCTSGMSVQECFALLGVSLAEIDASMSEGCTPVISIQCTTGNPFVIIGHSLGQTRAFSFSLTTSTTGNSALSALLSSICSGLVGGGGSVVSASTIGNLTA